MSHRFGYIISFAAGAMVCAAIIVGDSIGAKQDVPTETVVRPAQQNRANDRTKHLPTHEKVECCLKVAEDIDHKLADRLREQHTANPDAFAVQLHMQGQRLLDLCELRSNDPALYGSKLLEMRYDAKVNEVGTAMCAAAEQGNEKLVVDYENELLSNIRMQLVFEIKARGEFLIRLEQEVEKLRNELDTMAGQFNDTVQTRMAEIKDCELPLHPTWQQQSRTVVPVNNIKDAPEE